MKNNFALGRRVNRENRKGLWKDEGLINWLCAKDQAWFGEGSEEVVSGSFTAPSGFTLESGCSGSGASLFQVHKLGSSF